MTTHGVPTPGPSAEALSVEVVMTSPGDEHGQGADDRGAWAEQVHLLSSWVWPPTARPAIGN